MYVCICEAVTDRDIRRAVLQGKANCLRSARRETGACGQCGKCAANVRAVITEGIKMLKSQPARSAA